MELLIKNGTVVTDSESFIADIAVKDGKIACIGMDLPIEAKKVVDASGKYVLPGAIDVHTHLAMPFGGTVSADGYLSGTRAAACGGVTTVFDYPMQRRGKGILETVKERNKMCAPEACVDYAFHCIITDLNDGTLLDEFQAAVDYGITSFKCFLVYKKEGMMVDDATLVKVLLKAKEVGALLIAVCDPISLGMFESPGALGADIAVGEAQPLGNPMNFGGPLLGYFAVKSPLTRRMPGRIAGETTDSQGRRGFVLTLQAREQHIRREKATSNICTNQALCALAAVSYLSLMGKEGLKEVATQCINKSVYTYKSLLETGQVSRVFNAPFFREFVVKPNIKPSVLNEAMLAETIIGGYDLTAEYPELEGCWLVAVTEKRSREEIDYFVDKVNLMCREGL